MKIVMTNEDINQYRKILQAKVVELEIATRQRDQIVVEKTADDMERTLGAAEREMAVRQLEAKSSNLRQMRAALSRIEDKTYGMCQECEGPIGPVRLKAMPFAALCIRCQAAADAEAYALPMAA